MIKNKKITFLVLITIFFFMPSKVIASCSYSETVRLKKIAQNVVTTYDYESLDSKISFNISITNLHKDIYIYDVHNNKDYYYMAQNEIKISGIKDGVTARFVLKSNVANCLGEELSTIYVNLPNYNKFWNDPLCEGISQFSLCQKWTSNDIKTYARFRNEINAYKLTLTDNDKNIDIEKETENVLNIIFHYLIKYYYVILITIIVVCLIIIYRLRKKDDFAF